MTWELRELSPKHKDALALLAQGVSRPEVATICGFEPEYISYIARQPVAQQFVREMAEANNLRLELLFDKSVDVIARTMQNGTGEEQLKAARLQMEATNRLGKNAGIAPVEAGVDRLEKLAERLLALQANTLQKGRLLNGQAQRLQDDDA